MDKVTLISGVGVPLRRSNVDTPTNDKSNSDDDARGQEDIE